MKTNHKIIIGNSMGYEIDPALENVIDRIKKVIVDSSKRLIRKRLAKHMESLSFIQNLRHAVTVKNSAQMELF